MVSHHLLFSFRKRSLWVHITEKSESILSRSVKIKIKYLDDSQREVQARLTDKLGGFKRVHFAGDMSDDRTVRLIFNGHVLNADSQTLEQGRSTV